MPLVRGRCQGWSGTVVGVVCERVWQKYAELRLVLQQDAIFLFLWQGLAISLNSSGALTLEGIRPLVKRIPACQAAYQAVVEWKSGQVTR